MTRPILVLLVFLLTTGTTRAADVWVVHGEATTPKSATLAVRWEAGAILHNVSGAPARVRRVGGSAGTFSGVTTATIPAGQSVTASFGGLTAGISRPLWVSRFEVPAGTQVEGRLELWEVETVAGRPPAAAPFTKLPMPVFDRLVPSGEEQFHFGADLGGRRSRINLAVYNAGDSAATARVTLYASLCSAILTEQTVLVPANEIVQVPLNVPAVCCGSCSASWPRHVRVVVDRPSFSFVSVLASDAPPDATAAVVSSVR